MTYVNTSLYSTSGINVSDWQNTPNLYNVHMLRLDLQKGSYTRI